MRVKGAMDRGIKRCFFIALLFSFLVWGCGGVQAPPVSPTVSTGPSQEIKELNSKLISQGLHSAINPADYLIGPGDLLEVKVFESESLTSLVAASGSWTQGSSQQSTRAVVASVRFR